MEVTTLSGNLLAEWTFDIASMHEGATHRATATSFQVGGKGINVSRILQRLGTRTEAIGFAEGAMAAFCTEWLNERHLAHRLLPLKSGVRPGLVVRDSGSSKETTFLGTDLPVPQASWKAVFNHVSTSRPDWLAICGSIPGWKSAWANDLKVLLESKANTRICADTYGPPLESLVKLPIDLVKINRQELEKLAPAEQGKPTLEVLKSLLSEKPVRNWIITDGAQPLIAAFEDGSMYEMTPASIGEVSPTGSGDTFLAAVLQKWDSNNHEEMLNHAGACATANAASEGIGDFPLPVPERYLPTIRQL